MNDLKEEVLLLAHCWSNLSLWSRDPFASGPVWGEAKQHVRDLEEQGCSPCGSYETGTDKDSTPFKSMVPVACFLQPGPISHHLPIMASTLEICWWIHPLKNRNPHNPVTSQALPQEPKEHIISKSLKLARLGSTSYQVVETFLTYSVYIFLSSGHQMQQKWNVSYLSLSFSVFLALSQ